MLVDISEIRKTLNDEEKEILDIMRKAINKPNIPARILNIAFIIVLLYVCFTFLPLWTVAILIGIKLALPLTEVIKYCIVAKRMLKDHKNANQIVLQIRAKIAGLAEEVEMCDKIDKDSCDYESKANTSITKMFKEAEKSYYKLSLIHI